MGILFQYFFGCIGAIWVMFLKLLVFSFLVGTAVVFEYVKIACTNKQPPANQVISKRRHHKEPVLRKPPQ